MIQVSEMIKKLRFANANLLNSTNLISLYKVTMTTYLALCVKVILSNINKKVASYK